MKAVGMAILDEDVAPWLCPIDQQPLAVQVAEKIRSGVLCGHWSPGERLPNEDQLCKIFEVSRGTLREAIGMLVFAGVIIRRHGSGTYVTAASCGLG